MKLIICLTPLQALIAQQLIRAQPTASFDLLMLCYPEADNAKFHYYFQQTALLCRNAQYVVLPSKPWPHLRTLQKICQHLSPHYEGIFAASIDNLNVQYILDKFTSTPLETFDDGTGNLIPSSILYRNKPHSLPYRLLRQLLGIRRDTEDFRRHSICHHTLYPDLPNIAAPVLPIHLWPSLPTISQPKAKQRILLGQPVYAQAEANIRLSQALLRQFNIEYYFPHPREHYRLENVNYIDTHFIFEEYLLQQIQTMPDTVFHLYHLASTAALNVYYFPNVVVHAIQPAATVFKQAPYQHLYVLMAQMGMQIHHLSEDAPT